MTGYPFVRSLGILKIENGDSIFDIQKNKTESWTFLKQDHILGGIEKQLAEGT